MVRPGTRPFEPSSRSATRDIPAQTSGKVYAAFVVNTVTEMVSLIEVMRSFEANQKAALAQSDPNNRRLYDHILALMFEHGPLTDWQLAEKLSGRMGERIIATSAGRGVPTMMVVAESHTHPSTEAAKSSDSTSPSRSR